MILTGIPSAPTSAAPKAPMNAPVGPIYKGSQTFYLSATLGAGIAVPMQDLAADFQADAWKLFPLLQVSLKFKPLGPIDGERFENPNLNSKGLSLFGFATLRSMAVSAVYNWTTSFVLGFGWDFWI